MQKIELEQYLNHLSSGKVSALEVYNQLSNCNYNVGLDINYFQEEWIPSGSIKNRESKVTLLFTDEAESSHIQNYDVVVFQSLQYQFNENKKVWMDYKNSKHYDNLFHDLIEHKIEVDTIVVDCKNCYDNINDSMEANIMKAYHIIQTIAKLKQNTSFLCLWICENKNLEKCFSQALKGFAKTVYEETQNIVLRIVYIDKKNTLGMDQIIEDEKFDGMKEFEVQYEKSERMVKRFTMIDSLQQSNPIHFMGNNAYIVSGGHGRIGREIVKALMKWGANQIFIIGRSNVTNDQLKEWFKEEAKKVQYYRADIANGNEVKKIHESILHFGYELKGVIHCSGVFHNSFTINKQSKDIWDVLAPKINGTMVLHHELLNENLDFFITFSSVAGILGKMGQADYAYANSFLDCFCDYREKLREGEICKGKTICINWPYWSEGGMAIDDYEIDLLYEKLGAAPLTNKFGVEAFHDILQAKAGSYTVLYGKREKLREVLENKSQEVSCETIEPVQLDVNDLQQKTNKWLLTVFEDTFGIKKDDFDLNTGFDELGIDSIGFNRVQVKLEKQLGPIKKTLLYETKNISEIAEYLLGTMSEKLKHMFCIRKPPVLEKKENVVSEKKSKSRPMIQPQDSCDEIAVIGMSGRFPGALNCEDLWENLKNGIDCVGEIPNDRWNVRDYYNGDIKNLPEGKTYCKWGGFLANVDKFDPQFFNMSPKEAAMTDPQERLMLEVAWETFEDAGYNNERLQEICDENGNALVGTFMSTASNTYNLIGVEQWKQGNYIVPNSLPWSLSNRISYFMKFSAPSFTVDAACAGGIVALHQAINSIKNHECKMALVGGANLYLHPYKYVSLSQVKMLSKTGRCYAFSEKADGFVPGESVACVLLKPLQAAKRDNDKIYGVIKASEINHDADSNGYMAPNPKAQELLIRNVMNKSGTSARAISYIEAHGTGTPLGDPIEVNALSNAFQRSTMEKQFCAIGSIKSNIGHSEGAAGIVGLIKVLLQMKYKTLVPSLHTEKLSTAIDFKNSPFYVQRTLQKWNRPVIEQNGERKECLRMAGISSFGAGGANGHIIVEEYEDQRSKGREREGRTYVLPISAKTQKQLEIYIELIYQTVMNKKDYLKLSSIAYTLQHCRNEMEYRTAFIVTSLDDFIGLMKDAINKESNPRILNGMVKRNHVKNSEKSNIEINNVGDACNLAEMWVQGNNIDWEKANHKIPEIADIPTYPFVQKSCWVKKVEKTEIVQKEIEVKTVETVHKVAEAKKNDLEELIQEIVSDKADITQIIEEIEAMDKMSKNTLL